jgi:hypothetical protein
MGCEDPVDIGSGSSGGGAQQAVGTTQTTSAELPTNNAGSDTSDSSGAQPQAPAQAQAATPPSTTDNSQAQQPQTAPPADTSAYGSLPMPNAETQVGSYSQSTTVYPGGTGPYVTNLSGAPSQRTNGNGSSAVVGAANGPNAYSPSASSAIGNSTPANTAVAVGAPGTPNDVAPASRTSSQSVYNGAATQAPTTSQLRTAATVATPVQSPRPR